MLLAQGFCTFGLFSKITDLVANEEITTTIKATIKITKTDNELNKFKEVNPTIVPKLLLTNVLIKSNEAIELTTHKTEFAKLSIKNILKISLFLKPRVIRSLISSFCSLALM